MLNLEFKEIVTKDDSLILSLINLIKWLYICNNKLNFSPFMKTLNSFKSSTYSDEIKSAASRVLGFFDGSIVPIPPIINLPNALGDVEISGDENNIITIKNLTKGFGCAVLDPFINSGTWMFEGRCLRKKDFVAFGLMSATKEKPFVDFNNDGEYLWYFSEGNVTQNGDHIGNRSWKVNDIVTLEVSFDAESPTLGFYVNRVKQPLRFVNIPKSIRFFACSIVVDDCFEVLLLKPSYSSSSSSSSIQSPFTPNSNLVKTIQWNYTNTDTDEE
jgi:hypothetical protein